MIGQDRAMDCLADTHEVTALQAPVEIPEVMGE